MTVKDLIEKLNKIDNKELPVVVGGGDFCLFYANMAEAIERED